MVQLTEGKTPNVIEITNDEIMQYVDELRQQIKSRER
jgi:hypothetical protein